MRAATRVIATALGVFAGFGGPEHGYFEILQGHRRPEGLFITAVGPPCDPQAAWHLCEPALTIVPSFLVSGVLASVLGLVTMVWAALFVHRPYGGAVLIGLSLALLLVGGGLIPPLIGIVGGVVATRIRAPVRRRAGEALGLLAALWPWPLVAFFGWLFGQVLVGAYSNALVQELGLLSPLLIVGLLTLSVVSGYAYDARRGGGAITPSGETR